MTKRYVLVLLMLACASTAAAQLAGEPPPAKPAPPAAVPVQPARRGQLANVKVDVTITDQVATKPPVVKTFSVVVADSRQGMVRTDSEAPRLASGEGPTQNVPLHVDARPSIEEGGKIRLGLGLTYSLLGRIEPDLTGLNESQKVPVARQAQLGTTNVRENLELVLENGKPMVVAQSADPLSDRKVTVEVKATILR
jgi:hypothetical protein